MNIHPSSTNTINIRLVSKKMVDVILGRSQLDNLGKEGSSAWYFMALEN